MLFLKLKKVLDSPLFKIVSSAGGAVIGKKKKTGIRGYTFKVIAMMLVPVLVIAVLMPDNAKITTVSSNKITYMTPEQYEEYSKVNGTPAYWESQVGTNTGLVGGSTVGAVDTDYVLDYDASKLTDMDLTRLQEYLTICEKAASSAGVPTWVIMAINTLESNPINLSGSGVYVGPASFDGKRTYGNVHPTTGKVVNYTNYGYDEAKEDGALDGTHKGPFQLNADYNCSDPYNFSIAVDFAAKTQNERINAATKYFEGVTSDTNFLWAVAITMHNTGTPGFMGRVPKFGVDTRQHFYNTMVQIQNKPQFKDVSERMFKAWDQEVNLRDMFLLFDGLDGIMYAKELVDDFSMTNVTSPIYNPDGTRIKSTPGTAGTAGGPSGTYKGDGLGETTYTQGFKVYMHSGKYGCVIGSVGDTKYGWEFDYEAGRYLFGGLTKGRYMENTIRAALKGASSGSVQGGGAARATYIWESPLIQEVLPNAKPQELTGNIGEVGYKGNFPIFIQSSGVNDISNLKWKFGGKSTTLGQSGCSMFALMSLIHGAGYGNMPLPITTNGTDGIDANGVISFKEMTKALPNGPIVADDVSALGYIVKTIPTDDKGLEVIYSHLMSGIPFVANVRYGDITGYDESYNPHTVHFTNEGHFILMVGAYELNGKRYVEVVQSTYSNAGTAKYDQNKLVFDYDELIDKQIIRSSSGTKVPAYTILGMQGSDVLPNYLKSGYTPPIRVLKTTSVPLYVGNPTSQAAISVNELKSRIEEEGHILLPKDLYVNVGKDYVDLFVTETTSLRIRNVQISANLTENMHYPEGTYIGEIMEDVVFERYEMGERVQLR